MTDGTNGTHGGNGRQAPPCGEAERRALVEYVYGEIAPEARARVDAHLETCGECRLALDQMRAARVQLAGWSVPEPEPGFALVGARERRSDGPRHVWLPVGVAAAAVLVAAAGAAIANLEIRYNSDGLTVRTGWAESPQPRTAAAVTGAPAPASRATDAPAPAASPMTAGQVPAGSPWREDLSALERRLRTEFSAAPLPATGPTVSNAELLRRVQALIEDSEQRQRRELALRVAQVVRDFDAQRESDLVRIQRGLGVLEGSSAADRQLLNYLVRVSTPQR